MRDYGKGLLAGLIATIALSLLMVFKSALGLAPHLNVIQMLSGMLGAPNNQAVGWSAHFFIGTVAWGALFAWFAPTLPGAYWWRGAMFATGAWLLMMVVLMPMAGAGLFALRIGATAPVVTLLLHWVFGIVLGLTYGATAHGAQGRYAAQR